MKRRISKQHKDRAASLTAIKVNCLRKMFARWELLPLLAFFIFVFLFQGVPYRSKRVWAISSEQLQVHIFKVFSRGCSRGCQEISRARFYLMRCFYIARPSQSRRPRSIASFKSRNSNNKRTAWIRGLHRITVNPLTASLFSPERLLIAHIAHLLPR